MNQTKKTDENITFSNAKHTGMYKKSTNIFYTLFKRMLVCFITPNCLSFQTSDEKGLNDKKKYLSFIYFPSG